MTFGERHVGKPCGGGGCGTAGLPPNTSRIPIGGSFFWREFVSWWRERLSRVIGLRGLSILSVFSGLFGLFAASELTIFEVCRLEDGCVSMST